MKQVLFFTYSTFPTRLKHSDMRESEYVWRYKKGASGGLVNRWKLIMFNWSTRGPELAWPSSVIFVLSVGARRPPLSLSSLLGWSINYVNYLFAFPFSWNMISVQKVTATHFVFYLHYSILLSAWNKIFFESNSIRTEVHFVRWVNYKRVIRGRLN